MALVLCLVVNSLETARAGDKDLHCHCRHLVHGVGGRGRWPSDLSHPPSSFHSSCLLATRNKPSVLHLAAPKYLKKNRGRDLGSSITSRCEDCTLLRPLRGGEGRTGQLRPRGACAHSGPVGAGGCQANIGPAPRPRLESCVPSVPTRERGEWLHRSRVEGTQSGKAQLRARCGRGGRTVDLQPCGFQTPPVAAENSKSKLRQD